MLSRPANNTGLSGHACNTGRCQVTGLRLVLVGHRPHPPARHSSTCPRWQASRLSAHAMLAERPGRPRATKKTHQKNPPATARTHGCVCLLRRTAADGSENRHRSGHCNLIHLRRCPRRMRRGGRKRRPAARLWSVECVGSPCVSPPGRCSGEPVGAFRSARAGPAVTADGQWRRGHRGGASGLISENASTPLGKYAPSRVFRVALPGRPGVDGPRSPCRAHQPRPRRGRGWT